MDQVNTKYCLRKVRLDSLHPSPMGTSVNLYEMLLYQNVCIAPCFLCSHPCAPQELGSNSSLELNLSPDHFLHKCPKLQPCLWKEAEAAYAAAVPEEAYASGLHRHGPPWEIGWDIDPELSPLHTHWHRQHLEWGWKWNEIMHDNHDITWTWWQIDVADILLIFYI